MYIIDLFKNLFKKESVGQVLYFVLNVLIIGYVLYFCFQMDLAVSILLGVLLFGVSLCLLLSPIGEWLLRLRMGTKKFEKDMFFKHKDIYSAYEEVYSKAYAASDCISDQVKLYYVYDDSINAFALGRKTIALVAVFMIVVISAISWMVVPKAETLTEGNYEYMVHDYGTVEITKYVGTEKEVVVPDSLGGKKVTKIGADAFHSYKKMTSIILPQGLISIGKEAFAYCEGLKHVVIPEKVEGISSLAFACCSSLESLEVNENNKIYYSEGNCIIDKPYSTVIAGCKNSVIPSSVTNIGLSAFYGCTGLTSIVIPEGVKNIEKNAFKKCSNLSSVTIGKGLTTIEMEAFSDCKGLKSIVIPDSVTNIEYGTFLGCSDLTSLEVDKNNAIYYSEGNCIIEKVSKEVLCGCNASIIPLDVKGIKIMAFQSCSGLTSVTIPSSVKNIDFAAFSYCSGLTSVTIPSSVKNIDFAAFSYCSGLTSIDVDKDNSIYYSKDNCIVRKDTKEVVLGCKTSIIPLGVTSIGAEAFEGCTGLSNITIPSGVTSIGLDAFYYCNSLENIKIPASVTNIDSTAFYYCDSLTTIYAETDSYAEKWAKEEGYTVKKLESSEVIPSPTEPTKPDTTTQHPQETQTTQQQSTTEAAPTTATTPMTEASPSMAEVGTTLEVTSADCKVRVTSASQENSTVEYVAAKNKKASEIQIPDIITANGITYKVTAVSKNAFSGNKKVRKIVIGKNVTSIGKNAFANCKNLKTIVVNYEADRQIHC